MTDPVIEVRNRLTKEWTMKCARREEYWVCADCSCGFPEGMPDECVYGDERCTKIIQRDKQEAKGEL